MVVALSVKIKKYGNNAGTVSAEKTKVFLFVNEYYTLYESKYASICATAKGYESLYLTQSKMRKGA